MNHHIFTLKQNSVFQGFQYTGNVEDFPEHLNKEKILEALERVRISYTPDTYQPTSVSRPAIPGDWLFVGETGRYWATSQDLTSAVYKQIT